MSTTIAPTFTPAERKVLAVIDEHGSGTLSSRTFVPAGTVHAATAERLVASGVLHFTADNVVVRVVEPEFVGSAAEVELPEPAPEVVAAAIVELPAEHETFEAAPAHDTLAVLEAAKREHDAEKAGHPGPFPNLAALRSQYDAKLRGEAPKRVRDAATRYRNSVDAGTDETLVCTGGFHDSDEERVLPVTAFQLYESGRRRSECRSCCKARVAAKKA
jgi:hypothetical protein